MFGKNKTTKILNDQDKPHFTKAPKPEDLILPQIPKSKTWRVWGYMKAADEYTATELNMDSTWLTFTDIVEYVWTYDAFSNTWYAVPTRQVIARVRANHIVKYELVKK